jgi:hypothetical protein
MQWQILVERAVTNNKAVLISKTHKRDSLQGQWAQGPPASLLLCLEWTSSSRDEQRLASVRAARRDKDPWQPRKDKKIYQRDKADLFFSVLFVGILALGAWGVMALHPPDVRNKALSGGRGVDLIN